jgi:hypothetical protein
MTQNPNMSPPLDDKTLLRVLTWLHTAGVGFVLDRLPHEEVALDPQDVVAYLSSPETFLAEAMDVSVDDYRAWQAAGGVIQCHARTKSGRRCRNLIADADHYLTPKQWAALQVRQLTCWSHGGKALTAREMWETAE